LKKLGKYEVLGELGHGAMGVVYRARDPFINRLVALKTITTGVADDPALLQRFYREAQSAGGLQHPNIVTIYDMGEAGELPYIAMELVEGENLEQVIASRSALPIPLKLVYAMQACRAFDYAHKRGIVHRDIKPGNVMLSKDGTVKVVDFGIARVLENSRTQTGLLIGTFAYMSPEQYHGEHADERSDIWSFGVLVYELLCYEKPFTGPTPASLMHSICDEDPVSLTKILPECPNELAMVVSKMLRKSPAERYQSMEDVLLDLDPVCRTLQSQSVAELLGQTRQFFDQRRFAEGRDLVRQALQLESGNPQARSMLEKANVELKRISNRPKVQQFVEKGQALLLDGKVQEAKVAAESALQLDSSYVPAEDLQRAIQKELERTRVLAEWLEAAKQKLAEGLPDEAESLLAKVLDAEPSDPQAQDLQQQVLKEKAEREKARRLLEGLQQARELWTRQNYAECLMHLEDLAQQFPAEEEVSRLLESVREDQIEQQRQQALLQSRNLFAAGRHDSAITLLADLQKQFPSDEGISGLLEDVRKDQMNQRRLLGLAEARSLLAAGQYDPCVSLLTSLHESFPHDQEIPKLLEAVHQNKAEQLRQRGVAESRKLLAARRYEECMAFLTNLEKQFPGDEEILALEQTVREERAEQQKQQGLEDARDLLTARRYDECLAQLASLEDRFPADPEILRLQSAVAEDQAKQRRLQGLEQVRNLLGSKNYEKATALLAFLQQEFPEDDETQKLVESTQKERSDQRKREGLVKARDLLASQRYEDSIILLIQLQTEFVGDASVNQLLESARKEQAKHRQSEGVAQARSYLAARQYDESINLLSKLRADFPDETEIARLLATAQEDLAEHQKHQRLADARNLLAAQSFSEALAILDGLAATHPKDSAVSKLRTLVQREQSQHAKAQKLQRELDALKKMMGDKKYPEVISRAKELLTEFPADANLVRLTEFATSRQADIERELLFKKKFEEAKAFFDAGRFDDAVRVIKTTLRTFPSNAELQSLYQQCEAQRKKLQVRQQIEQRIREVKVKINRDELSEAVDLAQQTLVTLGPDTDLTHLLNSAQVELESREKKRLQEQTLQTIRTLIESGDFDGASRTIDEVLEAQTVGSFDPRIQRLTEQIKEAKTPAVGQLAPSPSPVAPGLSREYAFLQATPLPEAPPPSEKVPPPNSTTGTTQSSASTTALPQRVSTDKTAEFVPSTPETVMPSSPQTFSPESKAESPAPYSPVGKMGLPQSPPLGGSPIEVPATPALRPLSVPLWRKPAILVISALALSFALWIGVRSRNVKPRPAGPPEVKVVQQPAQPHFDPVEAQQRKDLDSANSKIAENDLDGAVQLLQQAEAVNGPLTSEIQNKLAQVEESKKDANLRQLRQREAELWQQATRFVADGRYTEAQKDLKQILALPAGGVRKDDAHHYLDKIIPQQKMQNSLSAQARQSLAQGDFQSARRAAEQLKLNGSNPTELVADIDQAEQSQLKQMESLFDQLKQRDDDSSIQQLRALQPKFQALAGDGGPQSSDALNYANNIPAAIADIRARMDKKSENAAFEQMVQRYRQAAAANDKNGLATARGDFQSIVQNGGAHSTSAQQYVAEINKQLDTLNAPPPPPLLPPTTIKEAPDTRAADEAAVRSVVQRFFQAFEQRNPDALRQVWPGLPQQRYDRYKGSFEHVSAITIQILNESVKMSSDGTSATVSVQSQEEETPKGEKKARLFKPLWTFQLIKKDGTWHIADVL
jgi:serine/threonine-protein kinase